MKTQQYRLFNLVLAFILLLTCGAQIATAKEGTPPQPPAPFSALSPAHSGPQQDQTGLWYMPENGNIATGPIHQAALSATGGPDDFGYTWNDTEPLAWIDVSSGINRTSSSVNLGFNFKFYENTFSQIYLSQYGYATFDTNLNVTQSMIPNTASPNNVIAPYWAPLRLVNGYIRYLTGGEAPNRYFVAEWNRVGSNDTLGVAEYTFEVILHENGDIIFQYQTMTYSPSSYWCQASGIEDSQGIDGLAVTTYCSKVNSNHAVRISRPAPTGRVNITPLSQGRFTRTGETVYFPIPVRNNGELGVDTYDLFPTGSFVSLYAPGGTALLTDTDGDGAIDTGPINQGATVTIIAYMQAPNGVSVGYNQTAMVTVRSSLNLSSSKTARLQTAIPASFAQVYQDGADGSMNLYLVQPGGQQTRRTSNPGTYGSNVSVAETPFGNFIHVWSKGRCLGTNCSPYTQEIEYTLLNKFGETIHGVSKLTDNSSATVSTYDQNTAVAVAPDGRIGIVWRHYAYQYVNNTSQYNYNIFFAVLDASGNISTAPINLTNNSNWGSSNPPEAPGLYSPQITATGDNRFLLAWENYYRISGCTVNDCSIDDIYYSIRDTNGNEVKGITQFTNDTTGTTYDGYWAANLTTLTGNRALLSWARSSNGDIYYAVLDSVGNLVKEKTNLVNDGSSSNPYDRNPDAVQLSNGKIVVGWTASSSTPYIRFAVLDPDYNRIAGPTSLYNPAGLSGNDYVSIAADRSRNAILTWMDSTSWRNLYYALVNGNGDIVTQPMIFRSAQSQTSSIETSFMGYGNTSYSSIPLLLYMPITTR
jgi:hypothetical protein